MQGMTMKSIKHHVALQPLFVIMGAGIAFVCLYVGRQDKTHLLFNLYHGNYQFSISQACIQDH